MIYSKLTLWISDDQKVWHALSHPGTRDLSMGVCPKPEQTIAWAKSHNMTIEDNRSALE
jgi:hypothetical protein